MFSVCKILSIDTRKMRLFGSAVLGSAAALLAGIFGGWVAWTAKVLTAPLMVAIAGRHYTLKKFIMALFLMLTLTFSYGGFCYIIMDCIGVGMMVQLPIGLITLGVSAAGIFLSRFLTRIRRNSARSGFVYRIALTVCGQRVVTSAYLDSGNVLLAGGLPVLVADVSVLRPILGKELDADILLGQCSTKVDGHFVRFSTVSGKGEIFVFRPDKLEIYSGRHRNILFDVMVGVDFVRPIADCRVLLSPSMIAEV